MTREVIVQSGHLINVTGIAFAPDSRSLASCSADESVRLWDIGLGCESGVLRGHRGPVYHVMYSANGGLLASGGWDRDVRIWDVQARRCLRVLKGLERWPVDALALSGQGTHVAAANLRGQLMAWDVESCAVVATIEGSEPDSEAFVPPFALSEDGRQMAFADANGTVWLLDLGDGARRCLMTGAGGINGLAFTPGSRALLVLTDQLLRIDTLDGGTLSETPVPDAPRRLAADGVWVVYGETQTRVLSDPPVTLDIADCLVSPDGGLLARSAERHVELLDGVTRRVVRRLGGRLNIDQQPGNMHRQFVLAASPCERLLAAAGPDGLIRLWDLERAPAPTIIAAPEGVVDALAFSPDGALLACGAGRAVRVWRHADGSRIMSAEVDDGVSELAFSAEGSALVLGGWQGGLRALDAQTGEELAAVPLDDRVEGLAVSPWNEVAAGARDRLRIWGPFLAEDLVSMETGAPIQDLSLGPDHLVAVAVGISKWLDPNRPGFGVLMRPGAESVILQGHGAAVRSIAVSPDGRQVATGGADGSLVVWDTATGAQQFETAAHSGDVTGVAWMADGTWVATTGLDGAVRVWDAADGALGATLVSLDEQDYVAVTDGGYYSATKGGLSAIVLRTEDGLYPFEQFDLQLNRPDLLLSRLGCQNEALVEAYADAHRRRVARLGLGEPTDASTAALPTLEVADASPVSHDGRAEIAVEWRRGGEPLSRLHVTVNDVPIYGRAGMILDGKEDPASLRLQLALTPGDNEVQLWAVDASGAQSVRRALRIFDARPERSRRLLVLAIGVSAYQDPRYELRYAAKDARDLGDELRRGGSRFASVETLVLEDAVRQEILDARPFLAQSDPLDHVVVLLAGHGALLGTDFAFLPADARPDQLGASALRYDEIEGLIDGIAARRRLVLLDTCHSGEDDGLGAAPDPAPLPAGVSRSVGRRDMLLDVPGTTAEEPPSSRPSTLMALRDVFADLRQESGAFVIAAAGAAEFAFERDDLSNGVFTASAIQALRADAELTVTGLASSVAERVTALTRGRQQPMVRRENLADDYPVLGGTNVE